MKKNQLLFLTIVFVLLTVLIFTACGSSTDNDKMNKNGDTGLINLSDQKDETSYDKDTLLRKLTPPGNIEHDIVYDFSIITVYNATDDGFKEVVAWYEKTLVSLEFEDKSNGGGSNSEMKLEEFIGEISGLSVYITITNDGFLDTGDSNSIHQTTVIISILSS